MAPDRSRHRQPDRRAERRPDRRLEPDAHDPELDSYLAALSVDPDQHATELTGRFGSAQVFQLRLPALRIEQLRRIAEERGVSPGSLVVDWVVERLDREDTPTGPMAVVETADKRRQGPLSRLRRRSSS